MSRIFDDDYDLSGIIVRPLYFGLVANIVIPVGLLLVCYYVSDSGSIYNRIGTTANPLFYIFAALALGQAGLALYMRKKLYCRPMIRRSETFEQDFSDALLARSKPIFLLIASISIYAYIYFLLTGRFTEAVFFVILSFLVFQVVRPRYGLARKLIEEQRKLVKEGKFLTDPE